MNSMFVGIACVLLLAILIYEIVKEQRHEGFASTDQNYFAAYYPKRSDVLPGQTIEKEAPWIRDLRYKEQYVDIQKLGAKSDLCRVVAKADDPGSMIMACALAGTDGSSSVAYRTKSKASGFRFSRDDYFRDINSDLRDDYCRILKDKPAPEDAWSVHCVVAGIDSFQSKEVKDTEPPDGIVELLWFYESIMIWYRFKDDLKDYSENTHLGILGKIKIDQNPQNLLTEGVKINETLPTLTPGPAEQFLRIGENSELELENKVTLRDLRAISVWVKFDMFTNNARIFDFGNGSGHDNVFLGIEGKGNESKPLNENESRPADVVCSRTAPIELQPQLYMKKTAANVEDYECPGPEPIDRATEDAKKTNKKRQKKQANLLFEIWDKEQRKMRIRVLDVIKEQQWQHITITTKDLSYTPTWEIYIDGLRVFSKADGCLPQANYVTMNYIGRSNWEIASNQGEYKDERLRGSLFDFRMYRAPMSEIKVLKTIEWGKRLLGITSKTQV